MCGMRIRRDGGVALVVVVAACVCLYSIPPSIPALAVDSLPAGAADCDGIFPAYPSWSSQPSNHTVSLALGDIDLDGDLDLVAGNNGEGHALYLNEGGTLSTIPAWQSNPSDATRGIAIPAVTPPISEVRMWRWAVIVPRPRAPRAGYSAR